MKPARADGTDIATGLVALDAAVVRLTAAARALRDPDSVATGEWSARMVLAHVTFWHESFARNVADLADGRRPRPLRGTLLALGERARSELGHLEVETLLDHLLAAHAVIQRDIRRLGIDRIPYRQGRHYTPADHLQVTAAHIAHHASELEAAGPPGVP